MNLDSSLVMVLDDSCLNEKDYFLCLMGKVKDFATLANLKVIVANEEFDNIKFRVFYLMWMTRRMNIFIGNEYIPDFVEDNDEEKDSKVGSYEDVPNGEDVKKVKDLEGNSDEEIVPDTKFEEDFSNQKGEKDSVGQDYFVMVRGDWMSNGKKLLIILVYVPQELSEKKMLWNYLSHVMSKWEGELVIMGDFNKVRKKPGRFGTLFSRHGADVFNRFISNAGLKEVPLEGCSFTWCNRSATKMSKLDHFLISDSLLCLYPNISSITLDRYLSDHWPVLMREVYYDYGPVPFRFFHYWFEVDDFDKFIEDSWKDAPIIESNALVRMMKKLKTEVVNLLQEVEKKNSLEAAQKAKIRWAIEGDENFKYYHGVINKKRNQLSIRGVLVEGTWTDSPSLVKIQWCKKKKKQSLAFNVDFEKVYDSVRWDHFDDIMRKFSFGEKWWIQSCLRSSRGSVIVNISPAEEFQFYNGLKKGSKVGGCMSRIQSLNETIERMACRLSKWKFKTLSIGGRLTLLKSVLGSMPIYHMSLFKVSKKVLHRTESMRSHFFNGADLSGSSLWARVIKALHGYDGKIGQKVKSCYPSLYALETQKKIDVASKLSHSGLDVSFRRPPTGGVEIQQFEHMKEKVEGCILANMMDRWFWTLEGSGEFTITSVRKMIDDFMLPEVSSKTRWIKAVPIKVNVHAWKVKLDSLPTRLNISRRGVDI
nr:RNA-directed DNA polymerase, eukaryota [Tanacetum cinerariifolium]